MSTFIGTLLDVSDSMRRSMGTGIDEEGGPWVHSIFEVIDNLIKHDVSPDNHVFAIGFGAKRPGEEVFDILGTLQLIQEKETALQKEDPVTHDHIIRIFEILETAGARTIRRWVEEKVLKEALPDYTARLLLRKFESDQSFLQTFVQDILPPACRDWPRQPARNDQLFGNSIAQIKNFCLGVTEHAYALTVTQFQNATKEDVKEIMEKCKPYLLKESVGKHSIFNVRKASDVLHGFFGERELSKERSRELLTRVEPYIYGDAPLYQTIENAEKLSASKFPNHKKLLFVLSNGKPSDGDPADSERVNRARSRLEKANVTVVSCFVTDSTEINPKRLYSKMKPEWNPGAKLLFSLSSKLPTQSLPRTIFVKRGWSIENINNETRLFLQVNHPDHMREACQLARNVVCSQDALSELLASISLDVYINQTLEGYKAKKEQDEETCYANAAATVVHLAMTRILGNQGGYPDFYTLREEFISCSKRKGTTSTLYVLQEICPKYRLRCKKVDLKGAMEAITSSRPVVARFRLTEHEWDSFENFYKSNRTGILTKKEINIAARSPNAPTDGHAVVLTSFDSECLRLLNSWGDQWADKGFFRVQNADVLDLDFIDVFWEEDDLTAEEKAYYKKHGSEVAERLMNLLPSLQQAEYTCPNNDCEMTSPVVEFTGMLLRAKCPKCKQEFSTNDAERGNILALNIYLTSLCD